MPIQIVGNNRICPRQRRGSSRATLVTSVAILAIFVGLSQLVRVTHAEYAGMAFSFVDEDSGGIALVVIDPTTGKISPPKRVLDSKKCLNPLKVRRSDKGILAVTNLEEDRPGVFVVNPERPRDTRQLRLPSIPDEMRFVGDQALVTCADDSLAVVDISSDRVAIKQLDKLLEPAANHPEDIRIGPNQEYAVVSFQKDSNKGKKLGSRIALFKLPGVELIADLPLPRDRPELHIAENLQRQGPGPEVLHISTDTDTLTATLDLYGAVGMMDWSAAKQGKLEDWTTLSTSPKRAWGTSFPDRAKLISVSGTDVLLVCNAGRNGGCCLIDLADRSVIWRGAVPPGLEAPVFLSKSKTAYSVCSGKTKQRVGRDVVKTFDRKQQLFEFDLSDLDNVSIKTIPLPINTTQIRVVSQDPPMLLIAGGEDPSHPNELMTFDPVAKEIKSRQRFDGRVIRFER